MTNEGDNLKFIPVWSNIIFLSYTHLSSIIGAYLLITSTKWQTNLFGMILYILSGLGITAGVHRLWSHRSYKANSALKLILIMFNCIAFQGDIIGWARKHRLHHKYSDTDADPHNATRGLFYSHIGWLLIKMHPEVKAKMNTIDFADLYDDPLLKFQKKFYYILTALFCFILPTVIPVYLWNETWINSWMVPTILRYTLVFNNTCLINSVAHKYGSKPYDRNINPGENLGISFFVLGEGFHNYHHSFPWDYKTSELGGYSLNFTKFFIDQMVKIGWAYDLKTVSPELIRRKIERTGDGSRSIWGLGEKNHPKEKFNISTSINT